MNTIEYAKCMQDGEDQRKIDDLKLDYGNVWDDLTKYKRIPTLTSIDDAVTIAIATKKGDTNCKIKGTAIAATTALHFLQKVGAITDHNWVRFDDSPVISVADVQREAKRRWSNKMAKARAHRKAWKEFLRDEHTSAVEVKIGE